jgi:hypothetical protein
VTAGCITLGINPLAAIKGGITMKSTMTVTSKKIEPVLTLKRTTEEQKARILKAQDRIHQGKGE